jgi:hypothetical protein
MVEPIIENAKATKILHEYCELRKAGFKIRLGNPRSPSDHGIIDSILIYKKDPSSDFIDELAVLNSDGWDIIGMHDETNQTKVLYDCPRCGYGGIEEVFDVWGDAYYVENKKPVLLSTISTQRMCAECRRKRKELENSKNS